jgi:hypothetical protein
VTKKQCSHVEETSRKRAIRKRAIRKREKSRERDWVVATAVGGNSMVEHGNKNTNALFELNTGYQDANQKGEKNEKA